MILAAAACAAAGISYIFNDDDQSINTKSETVTASSTIIDKQGIVKYVIPPRIINPYVFMYHPFVNQEEKNVVSIIKKSKSNQFELPIVNNQQKNNFNFKQEFSIVFFWSIPLKARLLQTPTKSCLVIQNLNPFQRSSMKISIGTQNGINEILGICDIRSEIALSNSDHTLDSLSYHPMINDHIIPIGILKKKKFELNEGEKNQKRFCSGEFLDINNEEIMKNMILKNVNLCVENLSKILSESCSNTEEQLTTLQNSPSLISAMNNNNQSITQDIYKNIHSELFKYDESLNCDQFNLNNEENNTDLIERLSDGIILHRGKKFGLELGEPMIRKYNYHSVYELNRLLSKTNCLLMREYKIVSIEDLIRLFLEQGQQHFTNLMINLFKVNPLIVEQFNRILIKWAKRLT